ncbi:MAG: hypothetical protein LC110_11105 [Burkholderiales bacterium]|nr:hypothetical protein [Burkholderiales bacterium]
MIYRLLGVLLPVILWSSTSSAEVNVCVEGGVKVFRSGPCDGGIAPKSTHVVKPSPHPFYQAPASQQPAAMSNQSKSAQNEDSRRKPFDQSTCQFQYHAVWDDLGKKLAEAAKEECLSTQGQMGPAYRRWKDHFEMQSARRQNAQRNSNDQLNRIMNDNKTMYCRPDGLGGQICR